jgi:hypothetical protein
MKLYHGTSERFLARILANGIKPRKNCEGNWPNCPSHPSMVYLTTAYPLYFALNATLDGEKALILEIESTLLHENKLFPDEDFIVEATHQSHEAIRKHLKNFQNYWQKSIEHLGQCCYQGTIPVEALTRYCLFDSSRTDITMMGLDPCISVINYRFCKEKYIGLVAWLFGDQAMIPMDKECPKDQTKIDKLIEARREYWRQQSADRTGVEVQVHTKVVGRPTEDSEYPYKWMASRVNSPAPNAP